MDRYSQGNPNGCRSQLVFCARELCEGDSSGLKGKIVVVAKGWGWILGWWSRGRGIYLASRICTFFKLTRWKSGRAERRDEDAGNFLLYGLFILA